MPSLTYVFVDYLCQACRVAGRCTSARAQVLRKPVVTPVQCAHPAATLFFSHCLIDCSTRQLDLSRILPFTTMSVSCFVTFVAEPLASCLCQSAGDPRTTIFPRVYHVLSGHLVTLCGNLWIWADIGTNGGGVRSRQQRYGYHRHELGSPWWLCRC
jgi:hypothetical protein